MGRIIAYLSKLIGMHSFAAYLHLEVAWVYLLNMKEPFGSFFYVLTFPTFFHLSVTIPSPAGYFSVIRACHVLMRTKTRIFAQLLLTPK